MNLRTRLYAGLIGLGLLAAGAAAIGTYALFDLAGDSRAILRENFRSLEYLAQMERSLQALERAPSVAAVDTVSPLARLEAALRAQESNITEPGEADATAQLRMHVDQLKRAGLSPGLATSLRADVERIAELNREALRQKNARAEQTAIRNTQLVTGVGVLTLVVLISFLLAFPKAILGPIEEFTQKVSAIAGGRFEQRVELTRADEFGTLAQAFNRMSAQLVNYQRSTLKELVLAQRRTEALLQAMREPLVLLDAERRVLYLNPKAEAALGLRSAQVQGHYAPDLAATNDLMRTLLRPLFEPGREPAAAPIEVVIEGRTLSYTLETVVLRATDADDDLHQPLGYALGLHDVTAYRELDRAKTDFMATISHELKTPLSSINLSLKLLNDPKVGALNDEQLQLVTHVQDDTQRLLKLVGELLDLSQIESGRIGLRVRAVQLGDVAAAATAAVQAQATAKGVTLHTELADGLTVSADPEKLTWVLTNLLGNAIRYSPAGERVTLAAALTSTHPSQVQITVSDVGPGIPPEQRGRLFERYQRLSNAQGAGSGLGLAISREFIEAMGGTIALDTTTTQGTRFVLRMKHG